MISDVSPATLTTLARYAEVHKMGSWVEQATIVSHQVWQ